MKLAGDSRAGPTSYEETLQWPQRFVYSFLEKADSAHLNSLKTDGVEVLLTTHYSGMGSAEWSIELLRKAGARFEHARHCHQQECNN